MSKFPRVLLASAVALIASAILPDTVVHGAISTIQDKNSVARIQYKVDGGDSDPNETPSVGMYRWTVDGVDQMKQSWFWVRVGTSPTTAETRLDNFGSLVGAVTYDTNGDAQDDSFRMQRKSSVFQITNTYSLTGGKNGSGTSDMGEQVSIKNLTAAKQRITIFQYNDFDLNNTPGFDTISITGANTATQTGNGRYQVQEVVLPKPFAFQGAGYSGSVSVLQASLDDLTQTNLDNTVLAGSGNRTWAFQWTIDIAAGGTFLISKDKLISPIPEPSTLMLLGFGGLFMLRPNRSRKPIEARVK